MNDRRKPSLTEANATRITSLEDSRSDQEGRLAEHRFRDVENSVARHDEQIKDHDEVLRELKDHLGTIVTEFADLKQKALIGAVLYFAGSGSAGHLLHILGLG